MDDGTKALYREILERYSKVIWTHEIHLCQANIQLKQNKQRNLVLTTLSVMVSAAAITNIFKWIPEQFILPILALLSLTLTFFTAKYKSDNLGKAAAENRQYAAIMHNLRNRYAGLLSEIKAGTLSKEQIVSRREALENEENIIYSGIVPVTSSEAVSMADKALKNDQVATTTDEEISLIVSPNFSKCLFEKHWSAITVAYDLFSRKRGLFGNLGAVSININ